MEKNKLGKFFRDDSSKSLFDKITTKAFDLQNSDGSILGQPENAESLVKFALYQPVIYCGNLTKLCVRKRFQVELTWRADDSGSMHPKKNLQGEDRMADQQELVNRISSICTTIVPDDLGVHLRFINSEPANADDLGMSDIKNILAQVQPSGYTEIGIHLRERILEPFLYSQYNDTVKAMKRPLFISIITDGIPSGPNGTLEREDTLRNEIKDCQEYLRENGLPLRCNRIIPNPTLLFVLRGVMLTSPIAVVFQISQIGSDPKSKSFLQNLKNQNLENVYITASELCEFPANSRVNS